MKVIVFETGDQTMDCEVIRAMTARYLLAKCPGLHKFNRWSIYKVCYKHGHDRAKHLPVSDSMYNAVTKAAKHFGVPRSRLIQAAIVYDRDPSLLNIDS
jgi:hypothetical protein